jgi:hypothetical protein
VPLPAESVPPTVPGHEVLGVLARSGVGVVYKAKIPVPTRRPLTEVLERLVQLSEATGGAEQAAAWRKQLTEAKTGRVRPPR